MLLAALSMVPDECFVEKNGLCSRTEKVVDGGGSSSSSVWKQKWEWISFAP